MFQHIVSIIIPSIFFNFHLTVCPFSSCLLLLVCSLLGVILFALLSVATSRFLCCVLILNRVMIINVKLKLSKNTKIVYKYNSTEIVGCI